jgi:hypothetical protein
MLSCEKYVRGLAAFTAKFVNTVRRQKSTYTCMRLFSQGRFYEGRGRG